MHFMLNLLVAFGLWGGSSDVDNVELTPMQFKEAVAADTSAVVIDVRRPQEFAEGHLKDAVLIDYLDSEAFAEGLSRLSKAPVYYVYCRSGRRSHEAVVEMRKRGLKAVDMKGGILEWQKQKLPVVKPDSEK